MEIKALYDIFRQSSGVNTDSRTIRSGELFFALKGENFDGNSYALKALEAGAVAAVVNDTLEDEDPRLIKVPDSLSTLKELAAYHRQNVLGDKHLPVIGLTGTNGKTTTKELIRSVLSKKFKVTATEGNLNNDIGVPLSVLKMTEGTQIGVIEMGANHPDDISALTPVSQPDFGLITNVGKAHLLGFGSFDGVKKAKGQLYDYISLHGRAVFVNADDPTLVSMAAERGLEMIPYGIDYQHVTILPVTEEYPTLRLNAFGRTIATHLVGAYNTSNVLAALRIGDFFGVPLDDAIDAVESYAPTNNRSQMVRTGKNIVIEDAYNANPSSMKAALDNFEMVSAPSKVVMLGNMGELGEDSLSEHVALLKRLTEMNLQGIFLVGGEFEKARATVNVGKYFPDSSSLAQWLGENPIEGATILVKGSRSTGMEKVMPLL